MSHLQDMTDLNAHTEKQLETIFMNKYFLRKRLETAPLHWLKMVYYFMLQGSVSMSSWKVCE